jgi:hypothetical protein
MTEISFAWLSRTVGVLGLLLTQAQASAEIALAGCPPSATVEDRIHRLETIELFDGNPAERVLLVPVNNKWDLRGIREPARDFYLVCKYHGMQAAQTIVVPKEANWCRVAGRVKVKMVVCG